MSLFRSPTLNANVWKMQAIRLLFWTHFVSSVLVPFYRDWGGIDFTRILLLNAWFMFWNFALEIPTGTVADFWGRRASVALGCLMGALAAVVYVSRPSFAVFLVAEVLFAVSFTLLSGADEALTYDSLVETGEEERAKVVLPRLESFKLTGIVGGALAGSVIAKYLGLEKPLLLQAIPMGLAFLVALTLREPTVASAAAGPKERYLETLLGGVRYFLRHPVLRLLTLDMTLVAALAWLIIWTYQPLLERAGVDLVYFGLVHAAMSAAQILVLANVARFEGLLGSERRLLVVSASVVGVAFAALSLVTWTPGVVVLILVAAGFGLSRPVLFAAYLNRHIPSEKRATVLSTVNMFRTCAIAVVNPLAGMLIDRSLALTLGILGAAMVLLAWTSRIEEGHLASR